MWEIDFFYFSLYSTYWMEVDITILERELLQVFQSHIRRLLHCLQVFLAVESIKEWSDMNILNIIFMTWVVNKLTSCVTCEPEESLHPWPHGQVWRRSDQPGHSAPKLHDSLSDARAPQSYKLDCKIYIYTLWILIILSLANTPIHIFLYF